MSMMMQCSDLNAPQKAKGFHKPSLMEVQKTGFHHGSKTTEMHHESDHARRWDNTQELEGLFIMESECCFVLFFHSSSVMRMYLGLWYPFYSLIALRSLKQADQHITWPIKQPMLDYPFDKHPVIHCSLKQLTNKTTNLPAKIIHWTMNQTTSLPTD